MKNRFKILAIFLIALLGGGIILSCSDIFSDESNSKSASLSLNFRMSSARAVNLPADEIENSEQNYRLIAVLTGDASETQEKSIKTNDTVALTFDNLKIGAKVSVMLRIYSEEMLVWAGNSEMVKIGEGENTATLLLHHTILYVSENGNDENSGTNSKTSLASLGAAFSKIREKSTEGESWTIFLSGKILGTSAIKAETKASSITITSSDKDGATLDAEENDKVLYIEPGVNFNVTLSNIIVQNGKARMGAGINHCGNGLLTLEKCIIKNNKAVQVDTKNANGGGISVTAGSLALVGTTVTKNSSTYNGGGIFFNGSVFTMDKDSEVSNNTANYTAGGVCVNGGTFTMSGGKITENEVAGISKDKDNKMVDDSDESAVSSGNSSGGGVRITGGSSERAGGIFNFIAGEISNNHSDGDNGNGGGIDITNGTLNMTGGKITSNSAGRNGGGIKMYGDSIFNLEGGEISENKVIGVLQKDGRYDGTGGAVHISKGIFTMTGGKITKNDSRNNAAGVHIDVQGTFTMSGGEISENTAAGNGGGVYIGKQDSLFTMTGGKITKNKAESYTYGESSSSGGNGGGIYVNRGTFILNGGEISENEATKPGGGIFLNANTDVGAETYVQIKSGKIINNSSANNGGGLYLRSIYAVATMEGGEISGNTAESKGGGVFVDEGKFSMSGGEISKNTAGTQGGGVYINQRATSTTYGTFTMTGGSITENWATSSAKGGGIFNNGGLALSGKITIAHNNTGNDLYSTPVQIFVKSDSQFATLEYLGKTLSFNFGADERYENNAQLSANLIDGEFEFSEDDPDLLKGVFKNDDEEEENSSGSGSPSDYTEEEYIKAYYDRSIAKWSEEKFLEAFANAGPGGTVTLKGNVTLTQNFDNISKWPNMTAVCIDGDGRYGIEIKAAEVKFTEIKFTNGAGTLSYEANSETNYYRPFGMIYWSGDSSLTFTNCVFDSNTTTGDIGGGAIALFGSGKVEITDCKFANNQADHGAAIDIGGGDSVTVNGCTFKNNSDGLGCDIYLGGSGSSISGNGNSSDFKNPYQWYDSAKDCENLFSTTGTRTGGFTDENAAVSASN